MNSKQNRISEISHIIESEVVRSQQDIISRLSERGIEVTQASLSRYLKEIQASRIPDGAFPNSASQTCRAAVPCSWEPISR